MPHDTSQYVELFWNDYASVAVSLCYTYYHLFYFTFLFLWTLSKPVSNILHVLYAHISVELVFEFSFVLSRYWESAGPVCVCVSVCVCYSYR